MVKVEDCSDNNAFSDAEVINQNIIQDDLLDLKPTLENERSHSSSSDGHLKSYFVGMGFSPALVDKVIKENGGSDANLLLETLFTYSALENSSSPKASDSKGGLSGSDNEEGDSSLHFTSDDEEMEAHVEPANVDLDDKRSYLLMMDFSEEEVSKAINHLGENALLTELVDFIVAAQIVGHSKGEAMNGLTNLDDGKNKEAATESLFGTMDKTLCLLQMGFTEREISAAIDKLGVDVPLRKLAESILSSRMPDSVVKEEYEYPINPSWEKNALEGSLKRNYPAEFMEPKASDSDFILKTLKKAKHAVLDDTEASSSKNIHKQPGVAFIRKEGYLHNLPIEKRFHILPKPPMTIEDALPHTKKWWPSWDTRKQLSCINFDSTGLDCLCQRLGKMMMDSQGVLSKEQQIDTLHQCKTANLVWVGQHRLSPIEPEQVEHILGYPNRHTEIWGLGPSDRLKVLKYSFQIDTLGYHLSVLKAMYPGGLRVLSIFSGIGGAEVTLHKLGIHLKCVVSVESSETNRKIFRRWWQRTGQSGQLVQIAGVGMLTSHRLENLIKEHGGFDIVIGANQGSYTSGTSGGDFSMGLDISLFFEYVRVFQRNKTENNGAIHMFSEEKLSSFTLYM
ncbi:hypothetical protein J5N97_015463 [Dioscorea zingiberensis]|uniref:SAM-dependent MTase DRM-type domain-containing protein n=1 Tax=Dioscorea zingiberensis TaxID=325984 RepID=A0A9D5CVS4_9LILI|nr:hypothetical protein J5N97_015463 [Dioscorea zingiberensis]